MQALLSWVVPLVLAVMARSAYAQPASVQVCFRGDVVVATVKQVSEYVATNGKPPQVVLEVHEVLRGDPTLDRKRAIWQPRPQWSGECLVGVDIKKSKQIWDAKPLAGPKVGDKLILLGEVTGEKESNAFSVRSDEVFPFSVDKRAWALEMVRQFEEEIRRQEEMAANLKIAKAKALADWRGGVTDKDLRQYTREADIVLVGKISSWGGSDGKGLTFFTSILKWDNTARPKGDHLFAEPAVSGAFRDLRLDNETRYLLFLRRQGAVDQLTHFRYLPIGSGDAIVIADKQAMEAVQKGLEK